MDEFANRMDKQRQVLAIVNSKNNYKEELSGLSNKAIERWLQVNGIAHDNTITILLFNISEKLFFLACKSQEQISQDYAILSLDITILQNELSELIV